MLPKNQIKDSLKQCKVSTVFIRISITNRSPCSLSQLILSTLLVHRCVRVTVFVLDLAALYAVWSDEGCCPDHFISIRGLSRDTFQQIRERDFE